MSNLLISVVLVTTLTAVGQSTTAKSPLSHGLELAAELFAEAKDIYKKYVVEPEARSQASRSLRRLANRLDALALAKEDLTASLLDAGTASQKRPIAAHIADLQQELREVRESLTRAFAPLPDDWKKRAGEVQRAIEQPLSDKATTLRDIALQLRLPDASRAQLMKESETTVALVNQVRALVNAIITELARTSSVPGE